MAGEARGRGASDDGADLLVSGSLPNAQLTAINAYLTANPAEIRQSNASNGFNFASVGTLVAAVGEALKWNHLLGFALIAGGAFFVFNKW